MVKKILLTGPESSGKTTLTLQLAQHFACPYRPEYAREFLSALSHSYTKADLSTILREQTNRQIATLATRPRMLVCDTGPEVIYIWSKVKYGEVDPFITQQLKQQQYDLRLLCYPDLKWEADPLREAPQATDRLRLWQQYVDLHEQMGWPYQIVKGQGQERLDRAVAVMQSFLEG